MPTITANTTLSSLTYTAAEAFTVDNGAELLVNASNTIGLGTVTIANRGSLKLVNTSTTVPIVLSMETYNHDIAITNGNSIIGRGAPISLGTTSGVANQTFNLSVAPLSTIPYPTFVGVETAPGSGIYFPWAVVPLTGTISVAKSMIGNGVSAKVCFWDETTRLLSFGDNVNGLIPPAGCNVAVPNIYIHSKTTVAVPTTRSLLSIGGGGIADLEWVGLSQNMILTSTYAYRMRLNNVGMLSTTTINSVISELDLRSVHVGADPQQSTTSTALTITRCMGTTVVKRLTHFTTSVGTSLFALAYQKRVVGTLEDILHVRTVGTSSASTYTDFYGNNSDTAPLRYKNLMVCGATIRFGANGVPLLATDIAYASAPNAAFITPSVAQPALQFATAQNVTIIGVRNAMYNGPRYRLFFGDLLCRNVNIYNVDYEGHDNTNGFLGAGEVGGINVYNAVLRSAAASGSSATGATAGYTQSGGLYNARIICPTLQADAVMTDGVYDFAPTLNGRLNVGASNIWTPFPGDRFLGANTIDPGAAPTNGTLFLGPISSHPGYLTLTGTALLDLVGGVHLPNAGDALEAELPFVVHGITGFDPATAITYSSIARPATTDIPTMYTTTPPAGITAEFRLRKDEGVYGAYLPLDYTNLNAAFTALGTTASEGFRIQFRVSATTAAARRILQIGLRTFVDPAYAAQDFEAAFIGLNATDTVRVMEAGTNVELGAMAPGGGKRRWSIGAHYGKSVYYKRQTAGGVTLMTTADRPFELLPGKYGDIKLFTGAEIQSVETKLTDDIRALYLQIAALQGVVADKLDAKSSKILANTELGIALSA